jgi:hypothetical protein
MFLRSWRSPCKTVTHHPETPAGTNCFKQCGCTSARASSPSMHPYQATSQIQCSLGCTSARAEARPCPRTKAFQPNVINGAMPERNPCLLLHLCELSPEKESSPFLTKRLQCPERLQRLHHQGQLLSLEESRAPQLLCRPQPRAGQPKQLCLDVGCAAE